MSTVNQVVDRQAEPLCQPTPHDIGEQRGPRPEPCLMVIFGATGDLTARKLVPAISKLAQLDQLPDEFAVLGCSRGRRSDEEFRDYFREAVAEFGDKTALDDPKFRRLAGRLFYEPADVSVLDEMHRLARRIEQLHKDYPLGNNVLFYLATPPQQFLPIIRGIGEVGLTNRPRASARGSGWARIIVEKPFGTDLASAHELNEALRSVFGEANSFRIDHYLGKETVQNVMVMRFANSIFELMWNREHIEHVQITVAESIGVEGRGKFFEQTGLLRDVAQNHLMQLLTLVAMEPPAVGTPDGTRDEKIKVLRSLRPLTVEDVVAGQYAAGEIDGKPVPGYREEPDVAANSQTETFLAVRAFIDNWRWAGVPFYLRCGKRLPRKLTEIAVQFQHPPVNLFRSLDCPVHPANRLIIRIQPDEGIALEFGAKAPGPRLCIEPVSMDFRYRGTFGQPLADAYQRLLLDVMIGNSSLFLRYDAVESAWAYFQPVLDAWKAGQKRLALYRAGTWGPNPPASGASESSWRDE
ncbi:MAG: glucose-6-phosphate dehydrogenase [Phycisphaerae bacterium]|nr:glucose-6-phosphate dehydrogenase [Phycisphaerae bacterium]